MKQPERIKPIVAEPLSNGTFEISPLNGGVPAAVTTYPEKIHKIFDIVRFFTCNFQDCWLY